LGLGRLGVGLELGVGLGLGSGSGFGEAEHARLAGARALGLLGAAVGALRGVEVVEQPLAVLADVELLAEALLGRDRR